MTKILKGKEACRVQDLDVTFIYERKPLSNKAKYVEVNAAYDQNYDK